PAGVPDKSLARDVTKVGIVGAGLMASQLALLFARRLEVPVVLTDLDQERVDKGVGWVHGEVDKLLGKGRITGDTANRLKALVTGSTSKDAFADADFVLEAVFEEMKVKQQVLAEVEAVVAPECILATNTSSLSVTEMASQLEHPERVVGFHFFNPVAVLPLLEIARADKTDDAALATAFAVGKKLKKSCVLAKDAPAFIVNRLLTRFLGEVTKSVDEGTSFEVADRALEPLGLPMSPFVLLELVGPAVALHVAETMHEAYPDRFYVSDNLAKLVAAKKSGIYIWEGGAPKVDPEVSELFTQGDSPVGEDEVRRRALDVLAEEIHLMLDEGVVQDVRDIDLAMLLGAGWPFHLGGITPYLDRSGVSERVNGQRFLEPGVASLPG
ncbi:MAG: 3-hydroxyacyl-CoA dehydrogenase family protein, partial [Actinomycetes bacterium]